MDNPKYKNVPLSSVIGDLKQIYNTMSIFFKKMVDQKYNGKISTDVINMDHKLENIVE